MIACRQPMSLAYLFPDQNYQFTLKVKRSEPAAFFRPKTDDILGERRQWLETMPSACLAFLPEAEPVLNEAIAAAAGWGTIPASQAESIQREPSPSVRLRMLGERWEPDILLMRADEDIRLVGGAICFPSSWSVEEKIGKPIHEIHQAVPGLNAALSGPIQNFLARLRPGAAWMRENWGLSSSPARNQHPSLKTPPLPDAPALSQSWLRIEEQALVALPQSGGILFGIRIVVVRLDELCRDLPAAQGLRRALETMPEAVAAYKNLTRSRAALIGLLPR